MCIVAVHFGGGETIVVEHISFKSEVGGMLTQPLHGLKKESSTYGIFNESRAKDRHVGHCSVASTDHGSLHNLGRCSFDTTFFASSLKNWRQASSPYPP